LRNGELLRRAEGNFDVLFTADRRMEYQQKLTSFRLGIVVILTPRLQLALLEESVDELRAAIERVAPGEVIHISVGR